MVRPETVPMKVEIELVYNADVFEGDPDDAYELARLETLALESDIIAALESVTGGSKILRLSIRPN